MKEYPCFAIAADCRDARRREAGGLVGAACVASAAVTFCLFVRVVDGAWLAFDAWAGLGTAEDEALRFLFLGGGD